MNSFVISSGHALKVRGASCSKFQMDEVDEARIVTDKVAYYLKQLNANVQTFHDDTSTTQSRNIGTIVKYHNSKIRDLDISIHFNAASVTDSARGTEVLYVNDNYKALTSKVSKAIAAAGGFKDRGAKKRTDLGFLNGTKKPAILIEICFVDSKVDAELYKANIDKICKAIAESLTDKQLKSTSSSPTSPVAESKPKEDIRMFNPSNSTLKGEFISMLEQAIKDGVISDKTWATKAKNGELSLDDAIALTVTIYNRTK